MDLKENDKRYEVQFTSQNKNYNVNEDLTSAAFEKLYEKIKKKNKSVKMYASFGSKINRNGEISNYYRHINDNSIIETKNQLFETIKKYESRRLDFDDQEIWGKSYIPGVTILKNDENKSNGALRFTGDDENEFEETYGYNIEFDKITFHVTYIEDSIFHGKSKDNIPDKLKYSNYIYTTINDNNLCFF